MRWVSCRAVANRCEQRACASAHICFKIELACEAVSEKYSDIWKCFLSSPSASHDFFQIGRRTWKETVSVVSILSTESHRPKHFLMPSRSQLIHVSLSANHQTLSSLRLLPILCMRQVQLTISSMLWRSLIRPHGITFLPVLVRSIWMHWASVCSDALTPAQGSFSVGPFFHRWLRTPTLPGYCDLDMACSPMRRSPTAEPQMTCRWWERTDEFQGERDGRATLRTTSPSIQKHHQSRSFEGCAQRTRRRSRLDEEFGKNMDQGLKEAGWDVWVWNHSEGELSYHWGLLNRDPHHVSVLDVKMPSMKASGGIHFTNEW